MKKRDLLNSIFYGIAIAMAVSLIILTFFMGLTCEYNLRAFFIMLSIAIICLALASINNIFKK